jgi:hypothetical protein
MRTGSKKTDREDARYGIPAISWLLKEFQVAEHFVSGIFVSVILLSNPGVLGDGSLCANFRCQFTPWPGFHAAEFANSAKVSD